MRLLIHHLKQFWFSALTGLALMTTTGCGNSAEVRYKVTVEIDDNGTPRSGSSVWSWSLRKPTVALASRYDGRFRGEAVAVDLGKGGTLFALLRAEDGSPGTVQMWPERLFEDLGSGFGDRPRSIRQIASNEGIVRTLPRWRPAISRSREPTVQYPLLVRFRSLGRPESVEAVDPAALDKSFGEGVKLRRITVQITNEAATSGIEKRLGWLEAAGKTRATLIPNPPRRLRDARPVQLVGPSAFSTELW